MLVALMCAHDVRRRGLTTGLQPADGLAPAMIQSSVHAS